MDNLEKYLKYYFLENYLFNEVGKNFQKRGYLTPEEFLFGKVIIVKLIRRNAESEN